jgi:cob(I)alamin adenosyltransferase
LKIYTRTGDGGETTLFGGGRVSKDHPRVIACGAVDELNAVIGRTLAVLSSEASRSRLTSVQRDLFALGSHLAFSGERGGGGPELPPLPESRPGEMEAWIDEAEGELAPLRAFILPGGSAGAAELHVCRTVCRRAERAVVGVHSDDPAAGFAIRYLNRLADLLFVLARLENRLDGVDDVPWHMEGR